MENYPMADDVYHVQQQQQQQQQQQHANLGHRNGQQWAPHLLTNSSSASFSASTSPPSTDSHGHYSSFYPQSQGENGIQHDSSLSLTLSELSVASSGPQQNGLNGSTTQALNSPIQQQSQYSQFQFSADQTTPPAQMAGHYEDLSAQRMHTPNTSRSSSSSSASALPRKRSFTSNASSTNQTLVEEPFDEAMDLVTSYDDLGAYGSNGSPVDGSGGSGGEDVLPGGVNGGVGATTHVLGKPVATNNFVTKLYQMINDPKSAHFISWTELGTSFVVSNVGEFSRSILGSHFKHNNFSSFVRQLNMYGFHKINRTPRAQRSSTDSQTWEFSHHKFLRGRPDLLDEIKRKALEPDPSIKHRVELPGEVAAQLGGMREENKRLWEQLSAEKRKVDRLANVVARLWETVGSRFPNSVPPFPQDLLENSGPDSPNIYISPPQAHRYPPTLSMRVSNQSLQMSSPGSSPTTSDFPLAHAMHNRARPSLSRQHSFQQQPLATSTPLPASPNGNNSLDLYDHDGENLGRVGIKRQRTSDDAGEPLRSSPPSVAVTGKRISRARSDSAPLGYNLGASSWGGGNRPRSGSGVAIRVGGGHGMGSMLGVNHLGPMSRMGNTSSSGGSGASSTHGSPMVPMLTPRI